MFVILKAPDGREWKVKATFTNRDKPSHFWWFEGNGSCDCNRAIFVNEAHGTQYDEDTCGDTWELIGTEGFEWADETI